jgi:hypothetical protein
MKTPKILAIKTVPLLRTKILGVFIAQLGPEMAAGHFFLPCPDRKMTHQNFFRPVLQPAGQVYIFNCASHLSSIDVKFLSAVERNQLVRFFSYKKQRHFYLQMK